MLKRVIPFLLPLLLARTAYGLEATRTNAAGHTTPATGYAAAGANADITSLSGIVGDSCTPTVTLVGGTGNVVPVYTVNSCRYRRIGDLAWVQIQLSGDGGAEGAGNGQIHIALPIAVSQNAPAVTVNVGVGQDGVNDRILYGDFAPGATTVSLNFVSTLSAILVFKGSDQSNTNRSIRITFWYEI